MSDPELHATLRRHFSGDERRFATSIDAVLNRITKLKERDFIWRMLNFVPEWDDDTRQYADEQMLLDWTPVRVILVDTGEFRPASSNVFTVLMLDYLWSWVRLRERWNRQVCSCPRRGILCEPDHRRRRSCRQAWFAMR
ncbi:hypothetical protein [Haloplanus litoreus]|uniref:Uncharacterized protein n=1 Tax=Haloplanus litoreus TaxID=767515 RepID=A0ABD6A3J5_9EURY